MTKDDLVSKDTALKMAIGAMQTCDLETETWSVVDIALAIHACKEALEAEQVCQDSRVRQNDVPAQEPVPLVRNKNGNYSPKHQWQGLTDDEIKEIIMRITDINIIDITPSEFAISRAIEAKLKEKNT